MSEILVADNYSNAQSVRNPHGGIIIDGVHVADTLMCVHCGGHFTVIKGSGKLRGFCTMCNGPTCGKPECNKCVPIEKWLDSQDGGR